MRARAFSFVFVAVILTFVITANRIEIENLRAEDEKMQHDISQIHLTMAVKGLKHCGGG